MINRHKSIISERAFTCQPTPVDNFLDLVIYTQYMSEGPPVNISNYERAIVALLRDKLIMISLGHDSIDAELKEIESLRTLVEVETYCRKKRMKFRDLLEEAKKKYEEIRDAIEELEEKLEPEKPDEKPN